MGRLTVDCQFVNGCWVICPLFLLLYSSATVIIIGTICNFYFSKISILFLVPDRKIIFQKYEFYF